jgi:ribosome modulation factor
MIHDPTFREGVFAGYQGLSPLTACPYDRERELEQRTKWLAGWSSGAARRRVDRRDGRHPDVAPRSEFGVETGHRAGKTIGVRQ